MKIEIPKVSILDKSLKEPISFKLFPQTKNAIDALSEVTGKPKTQIIEEAFWYSLKNGFICSDIELDTLQKVLKP